MLAVPAKSNNTHHISTMPTTCSVRPHQYTTPRTPVGRDLLGLGLCCLGVCFIIDGSSGEQCPIIGGGGGKSKRKDGLLLRLSPLRHAHVLWP